MSVASIAGKADHMDLTEYAFRGRVIKELGWRRTDLVITTKLFWGHTENPNGGGLSRKQYVLSPHLA